MRFNRSFVSDATPGSPLPAHRVSRRRHARRLPGLGLLFVFVLVCITTLQIRHATHPLVVPDGASVLTLGETYDLHDLGVADIDGNGRLDIYSVNHSNRQLMLVQNDAGGFDDRLVESGLSQSREFPGVETGHILPDRTAPGLYIYWHHGRLILETTTGFSGSGQLQFPRGLKLHASGGAQLTHLGLHAFSFDMPPRSRIEVASWNHYFVPIITLDPAVSLSAVFVGPGRIQPGSARIVLPEQDRHAIAWGDVNDDGAPDAFIARGGDEGNLSSTYPDARDELLVSGSGTFTDTAGEAGLVKHGLPGRSAHWVDLNHDGRLDLFVGNGRETQPNRDAPNQAFLQDPDGRFHDEAAALGLELPGQGRPLWVDVDRDGDMDLVWASATSIRLLTNRGTHFDQVVLAVIDREPSQMTAADFDGDGDTDVFVASKGGNLMLHGFAGTLQVLRPSQFGLPARSFAANWVDYDNDGVLDLHLLPQGIQRQVMPGQFQSTDLYSLKRSLLLSDRRVMCTWFDADNNGSRDLLISIPDVTSGILARINETLHQQPLFRPRKWSVMLVNVDAPHAHRWLQVTLVGPNGNRPAIGARVDLFTPTRRYTQHVGHAEGAARSQGHYRLYFGLGQERSIDRLTVTWPGGREVELMAPPLNRHLTIHHDS